MADKQTIYCFGEELNTQNFGPCRVIDRLMSTVFIPSETTPITYVYELVDEQGSKYLVHAADIKLVTPP